MTLRTVFASLVAALVPLMAGAQSATAPVEGFTWREEAAAPATLPLARPDSAAPEADRTETDPDFRLGPGDVLSVRVLEDPSLDSEVLIRPDGQISLPIAGALDAAGRTPEQIATAVRRALAPAFVEPPTVNVALRQLAPEDEEDEFITIYVLGEVNNPGGFQVEDPLTLLQAMALAGGPGVFADRDEVQARIMSPEGVEQVFIVDYEAIEEGAAAPRYLFGDGDTIVVPERGLFD